MNERPQADQRQLAAWLAGQFADMPAARRAIVNADPQLSEPPPLLVVETWMQATLFVYCGDFAGERPSLRAIRRLLSANTRAGIGSAILPRREALPQGTTFIAPPWLVALAALNRERLFAIAGNGAALRLDQAQLQRGERAGEYRLRWQEDIRLRRLAVGERNIAAGPLRGFWLCAELDSENQREDFARARRAPPGQLDPALRESLSLLGLSAEASETEIRRAFRRLARETHPDLSSLPAAEAEARFRRLRLAYQRVLARRGG